MINFSNHTIPSFDDFITEKTGIIERNIYSEIDVSDLSKIINRFMRNISHRPDDEFISYETLFDRLITISYKPSTNPQTNGATGKDKIFIYKKVNDENYLDVKYTLAHEMVHLMHQILSNNERPYEDLDDVGKLRYNLLKISSENIQSYADPQYLMLMLYMVDTNEVHSRNQNTYIEAFKYKKKHPVAPNQQIATEVLKKVRMTTDYLNVSIKELKSNPESFSCVISFLIGNFNELGKSGFQQFFDKSIFQLPVVKKLRKEIKEVLYNEYSVENMSKQTIGVVRKYMSELNPHKDKIIDSFIEHLRYWFGEAQKRIGKSIQLGIDDAMDFNNFLTL